MSRIRVRGFGGLAAGLALLWVGCVSNMPTAEQELAVRKANSRLDIGVDHLANGRSALALREFLAAEKLDPENARVQDALGQAYLARGKRDEAERHWRRSLELFPEYHDARQSLTALLLHSERHAEAIVECERLVDDPTYPRPWAALTNRAWAEYKLGQTERARTTLGLAREYRAEYWPATLALAIIESDAGRRLEAVRLFRDIIELKPGPSVESEVNYRLGEIYVALGKRREALGYLTAAVARSPEGPWAKKSQEYLKLLD